MTNIRYLNVILTVLTVVLGLQLWTTWTTGPQLTPQAYAQGIPDEGAQRQQIIDQLKLLNVKVQAVNATLTSGKVRVLIANAPDNADQNGEE